MKKFQVPHSLAIIVVAMFLPMIKIIQSVSGGGA